MGLIATAVLSQPVPARAGFDIDATLTLSSYSGYPFDRVRVTYKIAVPPIGGCWFTVYVNWDDHSADFGEMSFKSLENCVASETLTVPLIKPSGSVGKHKVCATPADIYGPRGPTICRTFTIKSKVAATPKPTAAAAPSPTPTPTPTSAPTPTPTVEPSVTQSPTGGPTPLASAPGSSAVPTDGPTATSSTGPSPTGIVLGALLGGVIVVIVGVRMFRPRPGTGRDR